MSPIVFIVLVDKLGLELSVSYPPHLKPSLFTTRGVVGAAPANFLAAGIQLLPRPRPPRRLLYVQRTGSPPPGVPASPVEHQPHPAGQLFMLELRGGLHLDRSRGRPLAPLFSLEAVGLGLAGKFELDRGGLALACLARRPHGVLRAPALGRVALGADVL